MTVIQSELLFFSPPFCTFRARFSAIKRRLLPDVRFCLSHPHLLCLSFTHRLLIIFRIEGRCRKNPDADCQLEELIAIWLRDRNFSCSPSKRILMSFESCEMSQRFRHNLLRKALPRVLGVETCSDQNIKRSAVHCWPNENFCGWANYKKSFNERLSFCSNIISFKVVELLSTFI